MFSFYQLILIRIYLMLNVISRQQQFRKKWKNVYLMMMMMMMTVMLNEIPGGIRWYDSSK